MWITYKLLLALICCGQLDNGELEQGDERAMYRLNGIQGVKSMIVNTMNVTYR